MVAGTVERERSASRSACQDWQLPIGIGIGTDCHRSEIGALDGALGHPWLADESSHGNCFLAGHSSVVKDRLSYGKMM